MQTRTRIVTAAGAVALLAIVVWALRPQPIGVETAPVTTGVFEQTVDEDGKTRVRDRYVVSAALAGTIARIALKAGDPVQEGDVVAVLTPTMPAFLDARAEKEFGERVGAAEAQRLRAHAELLKAQAQVKQAAADRDRAERLVAGGFLSPAAREQTDLAYQTAERALEATSFAEHAAQHDEAQAKAALAQYRADGTGKTARSGRWEVRSPVSGAVLRVVQESEGVVAMGATLLEIADPRSLEAVVDVLSQDSIAVVRGLPARMELGSDAAALRARVSKIEPAAFTKVSALGIEEQRVNVVLEFTEPLDRIRTIGDGFRIDAHIVTFRSDTAVKVPVGALFRSGMQWAVFVVDGNRAHLRVIDVARRNAREAMVDHGLAAGDEVIVYPSDAVHDGVRVAPRTQR